MTNKQDDLFDLIKTMTQNEKRYFKVVAFQHSSKNKNKYVQLFDLIHKQKFYNEKAIKDAISDAMLKKNFAVEKNYLYNFILKSLTSFHSQKSLDAKASNSLYTIKLLSSKALNKQSNKLIEKTIKFAEQSENYTLLLELLKLKTNYLETIPDNNAINETFKKIFDVQKKYINLEEYRYHHHKVYEKVIKLGSENRVKLTRELDKYIKTSHLQNEKLALSNEAKIRFNECWLLYYYLKSDFTSALKSSKRAVEISETIPHYITERKDRYISLLNNYTIFCNGLKKYKEAEDQIQKMKQLLTKDRNSSFNISCFVNFSLQETNLFLVSSQFEKLYDVINEYEEYLTLFESKILPANRYGLNINLSILFFINNDHKTSLKWINNIVLDEETEIRSDIVGFAWLFSLIVHFELEHYDFLDYSTKTTIKLLSKRNQLVETSKILSSHLILLSDSTATSKNEIYQSLYEKLETKESQKERKELEFFDIMYWVKSKIEKKPLKKVMREDKLLHQSNLSN